MCRRLCPELIRHALEAFRTGGASAAEAAEALSVSRSRLHQLHAQYLRAYASGTHREWVPGISGGDHAPVWPEEVLALLRRRLSSDPPSPYAFAASEALRLYGFRLDRAQVRRWALANGLGHRSLPSKRPRAPVRRWQRDRVGEIWQLDATPHAWFPGDSRQYPMLNMLDDCSRTFTGSRIYTRELLLSYADFLPAAFVAYGLPLELYVDHHSLFFYHDPESLTRLGEMLRFYGVSLRYAPTPQAKGKVEREHLYWQNRLPAFFAAEQVGSPAEANPHIEELRRHRNLHEHHRELGMTPQTAWESACGAGRSVLRPVPRCPWWPYVWCERKTLSTGDDGRVPVGTTRVRLELPPRTRVVLCRHPQGHHTVLAAQPERGKLPVILYTSRP